MDLTRTGTSFHSKEGAMQTAKQVKQPIVLPSCEAYEPQRPALT